MTPVARRPGKRAPMVDCDAFVMSAMDRAGGNSIQLDVDKTGTADLYDLLLTTSAIGGGLMDALEEDVKP